MSLQQLRERYPVSLVRVPGHEIEVVRTRGRGDPIVLLPGAQGTAEVFYRQLLAWGGQRDMVSVTYPGLTDAAALADVVVALADQLELPVFDLIGSSYGGYLAQWVAATHPARTRRLVVGNSFHDPQPAQSADRLAVLQARLADDIKAEALARLEAGPDSEFRRVMLDLLGARQPAALLRQRMLAVQLAAPVPPLSLQEGRLLLIECDNDPLVPAPMREAIRAHYPNAQVRTIGAGGHYPYILKADEYNAAVASFLHIPAASREPS